MVDSRVRIGYPKIDYTQEYPTHTHKLLCKHCIGKNEFKYYMPCNILKKMPDGKRYKLEVYGDRYWKYNKAKKQIRYVDKWRVFDK